jgi:tripartite-type tricarboxylate transporter receptor subunit TctC
MKFLRRRFLQLAGIAAAGPALSRTASAQAFPTSPMRLIVGFVPGGPNDILARLLAEWLSPRLGQPILVENLPGASSNTATEVVVRAPADGHTLLLLGAANAINASLFTNLSFDLLRDIAPVAGITREALVMVVHPAVPAKTVSEFIAETKANPGKIRMAMTSAGSSPHVTGKLFQLMTGVDVVHVPYGGGGPALKDLVDGKVQMMFEPMSASVGPIRSGALRALAVTTVERSPALPGIPTMAESVPGFEASAVTGIGLPAATPAAIVERLNKEITAAYADPQMKARLANTGGEMLAGSPAEFRKLLAGEIEKWAKVVKASGTKPD